MLKFGAILGVGLAVLQGSSLAGETVTLRAPRGKLFRTDVVLNDRIKTTALIDTGATYVTMCARLGRDLNLVLGEAVRLATSNGDVEGRLTSIPSVRIGGVEVRDVVGVVATQETGCSEALLGKTFLEMLRSLTISGDTMVLIGPDVVEHK